MWRRHIHICPQGLNTGAHAWWDKDKGTDKDGNKEYEEITEIVDEPAGLGVKECFESFVALLGGHDDRIGEPRGALRDPRLLLNTNLM